MSLTAHPYIGGCGSLLNPRVTAPFPTGSVTFDRRAWRGAGRRLALMEALLAAAAAAGISGVVAFGIYAFHAMRADFNGLRSEFSGLRSEFSGLRSEFNGLGEEMRQGFADLRAEIARIERAPR